jgi:Flp pilus assembly protein TadD
MMLSKFKIWPCFLLASSLALAACQNKQANLETDPMQTGSISKLGNGKPVGSFVKTKALSEKWAADQSNVALGLEYAASLEKIGQTDDQLGVLKVLAASHPEDGALQSKIGKQLLSAGRAGEALEILDRASKAPNADWKTFSALGSAYDQQGSRIQARDAYKAALDLNPNALTVQNNMAMSFALEGKLPEAEKILRRAVASPDSSAQPRIKQNLALVVGLQGHFDEARKIASEDLPPDQVEQNLAYLQQMLAQPNTWQQLSDQTPG